MVNLKQRLIAWLKVTLEAKGLVAALCICAMGLAALPWAQGPMAMALGLLLLFLGYQITQLMVITINEKKEEKKDEQEERLILTILEKCSTAKELQEVLGEEALKDLGRDIVRKRQTQEWWTIKNGDG